MSLTEENAAVTTPAPSPGAALRIARELRGWSVEQVAGQLKLSVGQITALEADAFDSLPGNTFVRGFVRNYARLLGLDVQQLQDQLAVLLPPERPQAALPRLPQEDGPSFAAGASAPRSLLGILAAVAGLMLGAVLVFWYMQQPSSPEVDAPEASVPLGNLVAVASDASAVAAIDASVPQVVASPASSFALASRPIGVASEPVIVISPASLPGAIGASVPLGHGDLVISAQSDSWVQVLDADGNKLYSGLLKPGAEQVLGGKLPYSLKIGNAPNTRVIFRGKQIDLASSTRAEVATFELK